MAEIAFIVEKLNAEPFKKGFTLVSCSRIPPSGTPRLSNASASK